MKFSPFVIDSKGNTVTVTIEPMFPADAAVTNRTPYWQTSWTSEYLWRSTMKRILVL